MLARLHAESKGEVNKNNFCSWLGTKTYCVITTLKYCLKISNFKLKMKIGDTDFTRPIMTMDDASLASPLVEI